AGTPASGARRWADAALSRHLRQGAAPLLGSLEHFLHAAVSATQEISDPLERSGAFHGVAVLAAISARRSLAIASGDRPATYGKRAARRLSALRGEIRSRAGSAAVGRRRPHRSQRKDARLRGPFRNAGQDGDRVSRSAP